MLEAQTGEVERPAFLNHFCCLVFLALLLRWHSALVLVSICVLSVFFLIGQFHFRLLFFIWLLSCTLVSLVQFWFLCVPVCVPLSLCLFVPVCLIFLLPCAWVSFFLFLFFCVFAFFVFLNPLHYHDKELVGSWFGYQKSGLSL